MLLRLSLFLLLVFLAAPARADNYADGTFSNLAQTMVRFNAFDLKDDVLLDEYAMVTDCDIFNYYYADDFKWNEVRAAIRKSISLNIATFPIRYHFDTKVQLGRYDFKQKTFRLTDRSAIKGVNTFLLVSDSAYECGNHSLVHFPTDYHAVLDTPITVLELPFTEGDADALLHRMDANGNKDHVVYVRFLLRIINVMPLRRVVTYSGRLKYSQDSKIDTGKNLRLDARLDAIDFYEDEDMTKLLYTYEP